jgi:hypothetical protein
MNEIFYGTLFIDAVIDWEAERRHLRAFNKYVQIVVNAPVVHKLHDKAQPKREDKKQGAHQFRRIFPPAHGIYAAHTLEHRLGIK